MERRDKGKEVWEVGSKVRSTSLWERRGGRGGVGSKVRSRREERRGRSGEYYSIYVYTYWIVYK